MKQNVAALAKWVHYEKKCPLIINGSDGPWYWEILYVACTRLNLVWLCNAISMEQFPSLLEIWRF